MLEGLEGSHSFARMPLEAPLHEIQKVRIIAFEYLVQLLRVWKPFLAARVWHEFWSPKLIEEERPPAGDGEHVP